MNLVSYRATKDWPYHVSAGGVVIREGQEVLLLKREVEPGGGPGGYHLPKGTIEVGESIEQAAAREITEEAGVIVEPILYLGALSRNYQHKGMTYDKTSHYFLCKYREESLSGMDDEHDTREWYDIETAIELLSQMPKGEGIIMQRVKDYLAKE